MSEAPEGAVSSSDDRDDGDASVYPGAEDAPGDWIDQDCDGSDSAPRDTGDTADTSGPAETGETADPADSGTPDTADTPSDDSSAEPDPKPGDGDAPAGRGGCASSSVPRRVPVDLAALALCALLAAGRRRRDARGVQRW